MKSLFNWFRKRKEEKIKLNKETMKSESKLVISNGIDYYVRIIDVSDEYCSQVCVKIYNTDIDFLRQKHFYYGDCTEINMIRHTIKKHEEIESHKKVIADGHVEFKNCDGQL